MLLARSCDSHQASFPWFRGCSGLVWEAPLSPSRKQQSPGPCLPQPVGFLETSRAWISSKEMTVVVGQRQKKKRPWQTSCVRSSRAFCAFYSWQAIGSVMKILQPWFSQLYDVHFLTSLELTLDWDWTWEGLPLQGSGVLSRWRQEAPLTPLCSAHVGRGLCSQHPAHQACSPLPFLLCSCPLWEERCDSLLFSPPPILPSPLKGTAWDLEHRWDAMTSWNISVPSWATFPTRLEGSLWLFQTVYGWEGRQARRGMMGGQFYVFWAPGTAAGW